MKLMELLVDLSMNQGDEELRNLAKHKVARILSLACQAGLIDVLIRNLPDDPKDGFYCYGETVLFNCGDTSVTLACGEPFAQYSDDDDDSDDDSDDDNELAEAERIASSYAPGDLPTPDDPDPIRRQDAIQIERWKGRGCDGEEVADE